jgi:hypothetical protein
VAVAAAAALKREVRTDGEGRPWLGERRVVACCGEARQGKGKAQEAQLGAEVEHPMRKCR